MTIMWSILYAQYKMRGYLAKMRGGGGVNKNVDIKFSADYAILE